MAAIIKMYTWWTIRRHKKSEEQGYKLVAVARKKQFPELTEIHSMIRWKYLRQQIRPSDRKSKTAQWCMASGRPDL